METIVRRAENRKTLAIQTLIIVSSPIIIFSFVTFLENENLGAGSVLQFHLFRTPHFCFDIYRLF